MTVVNADAVFGGTNTTAYISEIANTIPYGSLIPPVLIEGNPITFLYTLNDGNDLVEIGNDSGNLPPLKGTFDGQEFILNTIPQTPTPALVTLLNDARDAGTPITFTAEVAPVGSQLTVVDGESLTGQAGSSAYYTGSALSLIHISEPTRPY